MRAKRITTSVWILGLSFVGVVGLYLLYWYFVDWLYPPRCDESAGIFGDKFGGFNALFSALAFAGVLYTIFLQRHQLEEQKNQLLHSQLDSTFYQLLNVHLQTVASVREPEGRWHGERVPPIEGRDVFARFTERFFNRYGETHELDDQTFTTDFQTAFLGTSLPTNPNIWSYTQNLMLLISLVDSAGDAQKLHYAEVLRAQLSHDELTWLFCYSRAPDVSDELRALLDRVKIFSGWTEFENVRRLKQDLAPHLLNKSTT